MHASNRSLVVFLSILMCLLVLLPALTVAGMVDFPEQADSADDDASSFMRSIALVLFRNPMHHLSICLLLGLSMYSLFVVYLGGRSKHRRFNDRTIDANVVSKDVYFARQAAPNRAVFYFSFVLLDQNKDPLTHMSLQSLNPYSRRY